MVMLRWVSIVGDNRRYCCSGLSRRRHHGRGLRYGRLRFHLDVWQLWQHRNDRVRVRFLHVPQHITPLDVRFAALRAVMVLLARVRPLVRHQVALADEILRAHVAPERPVHRLALGVATLMEQQVALQRERFATLVTLERSLTRVRTAHVVDQMLLPSEGLVAHIAAVWIVSAVLAHVIVEMLLPRERFVAVLTFVR